MDAPEAPEELRRLAWQTDQMRRRSENDQVRGQRGGAGSCEGYRGGYIRLYDLVVKHFEFLAFFEENNLYSYFFARCLTFPTKVCVCCDQYCVCVAKSPRLVVFQNYSLPAR